MLNKTTSELAKANVSKLVAHLEMIGKWGKIKPAKPGKDEKNILLTHLIVLTCTVRCGISGWIVESVAGLWLLVWP